MATLQKENNEAAQHYRNGEREEQPAIAFDNNSQNGQMAENGSGHDAGGEQCADPGVTAKKQQHRGDQFDQAGSVAARGLESDFAEDVN